MRSQKEIVLVIAAHADDEVLGCGGSIARHISQGHDVHLMIMTDGVSSRAFDPDDIIPREEELDRVRPEMERRKRETLRAADVLGVDSKNIYEQDLADQRLDQYPFLSIVKKIEKIKSRVNPEKVYTHFWDDLNLDHQIVSRAVLTAFRPKGGVKPVPVLHFEVPESTFLSIPNRKEAFNPNHFVDITETLSLKLEALKAYDSEARAYPDLRSFQYIEELAAERARGLEYRFAEAFEILSR